MNRKYCYYNIFHTVLITQHSEFNTTIQHDQTGEIQFHNEFCNILSKNIIVIKLFFFFAKYFRRHNIIVIMGDIIKMFGLFFFSKTNNLFGPN